MSHPVAFEAAGPRDGMAIVFLHGATLNRCMWIPQRDALADSYRVIALDLAGHGARAGVRFRLDEAVESVAEIIRLETRGTAVLVGLSLGGYVAIQHACRYPAQVAGLVVSGSCVQYTGVLRVVAALNVLMLGWLSPARYGRGRAAWLRRLLPAELADPVIAAGLNLSGGREAMRALLGIDFAALLARCAAPVLILTGEHDALNRRAARRLAGRGTVYRSETVPDAGHLCSLERPEAFTASVRSFAESVA